MHLQVFYQVNCLVESNSMRLFRISLIALCFVALGAEYIEAKENVKKDAKPKQAEKQKKKKDGATNLQDAMRAALKNSAGYAISKIDNVLAGMAQRNAMHAFGPSLEVSGSAGQTKGDRSDIKTDSTSTGLELVGSLNIFHGLTTTNNLNSRTEAKKAAKWKLDSETSNLIYSVTECIVNLWYAHEDFKSAAVKKDNLFKELQAQKNSFKAGAATKFDVARAEASYEQAVYEADTARQGILSAEAEYERLTGEKPTDTIKLPEFAMRMPKSKDELESIALRDNPGILEAKHAEKASLYDLRSARGRLAPKIDLIARTGFSDHHNRGGILNTQSARTRNHYSVSLNMNIPVIPNSESQGNTYCHIAMANEQAKKAAFNVKNIIVSIKKDCAVNFNNYIIAMSLIKASESAVKSAMIGAEGDRQESALGLKSNTETLVRENQMYDSKKSLARSKAQLILAQAAMMRLMGRLDLKSIGL